MLAELFRAREAKLNLYICADRIGVSYKVCKRMAGQLGLNARLVPGGCPPYTPAEKRMALARRTVYYRNYKAQRRAQQKEQRR